MKFTALTNIRIDGKIYIPGETVSGKTAEAEYAAKTGTLRLIEEPAPAVAAEPAYAKKKKPDKPGEETPQ